jgi:hypothetical protein
MGVVHQKWDGVIKPHIDKCMSQSMTCWFIDVDGHYHAAAKGSHILKFEIRDKSDKEKDRDKALKEAAKNSPKDCMLDGCLHYEDGYQYIDAPYGDLAVLADKICWSLEKGSVCQHKNLTGELIDIDGSKLVAYDINMSLTCWCSTNKLSLQGCISTKGKRCPGRSSLKRVFGKNPNP